MAKLSLSVRRRAAFVGSFTRRQLLIERATHDAWVGHLRVANDAGFVDVFVREAIDIPDGRDFLPLWKKVIALASG
jgi:hypothetical protein